MIPEVEFHVWRSLKALTYLSIITTLLLVVLFVAIGGVVLTGSIDRGLIAAPTPTPTATAEQIAAAKTSSEATQPIPGVRVQTFAEIVPGNENRTARAWADGEQMESEAMADQNQLSASARASYPAGAVVVEHKDNGEIVITVTPVPAPTVEPTFVVLLNAVNLRGGPSTDYPVVQTTGPGQRLNIAGRYGDWWQVDAGATPGWIYGPMGRTEGDTDGVPVVSVPPLAVWSQPVQAAPAQPTATPVQAPTATPAPVFAYITEPVERHSEANTVSFYAYVHELGNAVGGLYLLVTHNGATYRSGPSGSLITGTTRPANPGSGEDDAYNVKIDFPATIFPSFDPTGEWVVTLVDGNNQAMSTPTTIQIVAGDTAKEVYLRFKKQ